MSEWYVVREKSSERLFPAKEERTALGTLGFRVYRQDGKGNGVWYSHVNLLRLFYFSTHTMEEVREGKV